jgi:hypothetical protein
VRRHDYLTACYGNASAHDKIDKEKSAASVLRADVWVGASSGRRRTASLRAAVLHPDVARLFVPGESVTVQVLRSFAGDEKLIA